MSVDILPASMPMDASKHFSSVLGPYLVGLIEQGLTGQVGDYSSALESATIAKMGHLTKKHEWLRPLVEPYIQEPNKERKKIKEDGGEPVATGRESRGYGRKRILLLGSGMVAQPVVDYLVCKQGVELMIGML